MVWTARVVAAMCFWRAFSAYKNKEEEQEKEWERILYLNKTLPHHHHLLAVEIERGRAQCHANSFAKVTSSGWIKCIHTCGANRHLH